MVIGSKTSVNLDKTEVVDLVDAVIFEPVASRDHVSNACLGSKYVLSKKYKKAMFKIFFWGSHGHPAAVRDRTKPCASH